MIKKTPISYSLESKDKKAVEQIRKHLKLESKSDAVRYCINQVLETVLKGKANETTNH